MGYEQQTITIILRLSRHNSDRDQDDNAAAERLRREIADLIEADPDYRRIAPDYA